MKKYISLSFLIAALFVFSNISAQNVDFVKSNFPGKEKEFKEAKAQYKQGNKYFDLGRGMYRTALEYFLKAQAFNGSCADLNYKIGKCYINTIQKTNAIQYLEKANSLDPAVAPDIKYLLGQAYHLNLEFDKAITLLQEYKATLSPDMLAQDGPEIEKRVNACNVGKELIKKPVRVFIDNLGPNINTTFTEYSPLITADESQIFFTSRRDNTTGGKLDENDLQYYEDIYFSDKTSSGWTKAENPKKPLNSDKHDATVGLAPDGQTLLIYKGTDGGDIFECRLKGDQWSSPSKLKINTKYHESSASISFDGRTMYFVSDRPGGYGNGDIYITKKDDKGRWSTPVNAGPVVNTPEDEEGVFMQSDGKTLYFSSKGHKGMGGYDIYKATFDNGQWTEPVNMGYPINTPDDDVFFSIGASGIHGYYSSVKPDGYGAQDIYEITFLGAEKPVINNTEDNLLANQVQPVSETVIEPVVAILDNQVTLLKGIVSDEINLAPVGAMIEITDNDKNEIIANFESNSKTGKYLVSLPSGKNYGIAVKAEGYLFHSENLNIPPTTTYREINKDIKLKKVEVGSTIVLNNIFFDFNKATLRPESTSELERLVKLLTDLPTLKIEISGHTDNVGASAYNKKLSEQRAKAVVDFLVGKGIVADRLTFVGYGFDKPIATNDTEEGRQMNRRTEFKILSK